MYIPPETNFILVHFKKQMILCLPVLFQLTQMWVDYTKPRSYALKSSLFVFLKNFLLGIPVQWGRQTTEL